MNEEQQRSQSRRRRFYDEEFKRNAVELLENGGRSAVQLSRELGVSDCSLGKWKRQYGREAQAGLKSSEAEQKRIRELEWELAAVSRQRDILKKSLSHLRPGTQRLYQMIETLHSEPEGFSCSELCRALGVSRSGFYDQAAKTQRPRLRQDQELAQQIGLLFSQSRCTYGARRLQQMLRRKAIRCGRNRLVRLMKALGLRVVQKRRFRPKTTQSSHPEPIAPNRLNQLPQRPSVPNQVWCADLTYRPSQQDGWLYLAAELDLCSKRIAGWKLSPSLATPLVEEAFARAVKLWSAWPKLHHSDRGVQYASSSFRELLDCYQVTPSMSRRACCYDNAAMESFWATLKTECFHDQIPLNLKHAQALLFDYIETFYNSIRLHSSLGYFSPIEFENSLYSPNQMTTI